MNEYDDNDDDETFQKGVSDGVYTIYDPWTGQQGMRHKIIGDSTLLDHSFFFFFFSHIIIIGPLICLHNYKFTMPY